MCVRSEAPSHASAEALSPCAPPATVRLSWSLSWPEIVSRDRQVRSVRVLRFWLASMVPMASMVPLVGSMAEKLTNSILIKWSARVVGAHSVDFVHVSRTFNVWSSVEIWPCPANGS